MVIEPIEKLVVKKSHNTTTCYEFIVGNFFPVRLRNQLKPILSQTEKPFIASNHRQFSMNIKIELIN